MNRTALLLSACVLPCTCTAQQGLWEPWFDMGTAPLFVDAVRAVHMIHVFDGGTGRVLIIPDHSQSTTNCGTALEDPRSDLSTVWTPSATPGVSGTFNQVSLCRTSMFCSGHSALADGRILVVGGSENQQPSLDHANLFEPDDNEWNDKTFPPNMNFPRWYATATTLPDGKVLATGGYYEGENLTENPELYDPALNTWTNLEVGLTGDYPYMFVLPDGNLFAAGPSDAAMIYTDSRIIHRPGFTLGGPVANAPTTIRPGSHGSAAMYAPGKVIRCGGGQVNGTSTTWVIDLSGYDPTSPPGWLTGASMNYARRNHNLVVLPDGKVLAVGGQSNPNTPILQAEIYDPASNTWAVQPGLDPNHTRAYHSTALLLRDGRVAVAGGVDLSSYSGQLFKPPYLTPPTGHTTPSPQPIVVSAPETMSYDGVAVGIDYLINGGKPVASACLMRLGSVTHGFDHDQRRVPLTITSSSTISGDLRRVTVKPPENGNIAPPGYYMLFILYEREVNQWVPCQMASYVRVGA